MDLGKTRELLEYLSWIGAFLDSLENCIHQLAQAGQNPQAKTQTITNIRSLFAQWEANAPSAGLSLEDPRSDFVLKIAGDHGGTAAWVASPVS